MNIVKLTDSVGVSAQITPDDVAEVAAAGYKVLINNRPDGEESEQPSSAAIAAAADAAGMEYHHIPVTAGSFPGPHFDAMSDLLDDPDRPVLAFCRTGTRCANLWVASRETERREAAIAEAGQRGYDLAMAEKFLGR
tara:strand:- start:2964 stop:3374 length:411 start_codon:yes stop_codon:yes gene_type:complete